MPKNVKKFLVPLNIYLSNPHLLRKVTGAMVVNTKRWKDTKILIKSWIGTMACQKDSDTKETYSVRCHLCISILNLGEGKSQRWLLHCSYFREEKSRGARKWYLDGTPNQICRAETDRDCVLALTSTLIAPTYAFRHERWVLSMNQWYGAAKVIW